MLLPTKLKGRVALILSQTYIAGVVAVLIAFGTGLIPSWGRWYSDSLVIRRQTDAILSGRIALSENPSDLDFDLVWANSKVQQVWGLGVAVWRLPFEVLARMTGQTFFPDRIAFVFALALTGLLILAAHGCNMREAFRRGLGEALGPLFALCIILLFPPFLRLCRGAFNVYEESVAYGYLYSVALYCTLLLLFRNPTLGKFILLSMLSGCAGFIRPTMIAYGAATFGLGAFLFWRNRSFSAIMAGLMVFLSVLLLLLWSNKHRFSDYFEFGHRLNLTESSLLVETRFSTPFADEPFFSAARELIGALFFTETISESDAYAEEMYKWQSQTRRWRQIYFHAYDWTVAFLLITSYLIAFRSKRAKATINRVIVARTWSAIAFLLLFAFYLRFYGISSRYLIDFAAAISIMLASGAVCLLRALHRRRQFFFFVIIGAWWFWQVFGFGIPAQRPPLNRAELVHSLVPLASSFPNLPDCYEVGMQIEKNFGIPRNGNGWYFDGGTDPVVVLFVPNPSEVRIELGKTLNGSYAFPKIRAKLGLEELSASGTRETDRGTEFIFYVPPGLAHSVQPLFLWFEGTGPYRGEPSFRLLSVCSNPL